MQRGVSSLNYSYYENSGQAKTDHRSKKSPSKASKPVISVGQPVKLTNAAQLDKLNIVCKDRNWIQTVSKEKDIARTWQRNWAFLAESDPKQSQMTETELPGDKPAVVFSDHVPNTTSGHYGAYLDLEPSRNIRLFEQKFNRDHRKKPMDNDLARP